MQIDQIATKQDIDILKREILQALSELTSKQGNTANNEWLRSKQVRQMLGGISHGTLQNLRIHGKLTATKLEGIYFYKLSDINALLNAGTE